MFEGCELHRSMPFMVTMATKHVNPSKIFKSSKISFWEFYKCDFINVFCIIYYSMKEGGHFKDVSFTGVCP